MTLPSNSSMNYSPNNTASQFTTKLNEVVELDGNWEVGLLEVTFPDKVENVNSDDFYYYMLQENDEPIKVLLPNGIYPRVTELIAGLHNAQRQIANIRIPQSPWVYFRFLGITKRMSMKIMGTARHIVGVKFSPALALMLGFDVDTTYDGHAEHRAKLPMNLTVNVNLVYVYCDLLEQVLVGDTKAPLLRIVSRSTDMTSSLERIEHVTFNPVQYVPLQKKCFDTVTINMMMDNGLPMPFFPGKSIIVLEFRRCAHPYLVL